MSQQAESQQQQPDETMAAISDTVLTLNAISSLSVSRLDASDVLEVYYLTRRTELAELNIPISKAVLGLRYRPMTRDDRRQELALEFSVRRNALQQDTIPIHHSDDIAWDNTGKVYYRETIDDNTYESAHYLASISGILVNKLLVSALDYANRKRYQPWKVVDANDTQLLRSVRDVDFIQYCIYVLINAGVELSPVITPVQKSIQLHANVVRKTVSHGVVDNVNVFYESLYDCLHAIATADYSKYNITSPTTLPPATLAPSHSPTLAIRQRNLLVIPPEPLELPITNDTMVPTTTLAPTVNPIDQQSQVEEAWAAASTMAQANLLSNDVNAAVTTIRTCWTDSKFGMGDETAFLYSDGSIWYELELIPPYISVATLTLDIPPPPTYSTVREDFVDYTIFMVLLSVGVFGTLLLLQQVLGRRISFTLYKYQRWFFHPTKYSLEDEMQDFSDSGPGGYAFGQDVIPLSMGGQLQDHDDDSKPTAELELVETITHRTVSPPPSYGRALSFPSETDSEPAPDRLFRDPNLVDYPNLRTLNTKIAIPVSSNHGNNA